MCPAGAGFMRLSEIRPLRPRFFLLYCMFVNVDYCFYPQTVGKGACPVKYQKWHIAAAAEQDTACLRDAGYPSLLAAVLAARGITTAEAAAEALEREHSLTCSPMLMRDMDKAVARIQTAPGGG